jgi:hypothetical protein
MNTQGGASASLRTNIRLFTTITSDEQYFLNEKAVPRIEYFRLSFAYSLFLIATVCQ